MPDVVDPTPESASDWLAALTLSKKEFHDWEQRGSRIVKRYRDDRDGIDDERRYNILWSNVRTLLPAVYAKKPKAEAERRYKDKDPVGRCASMILERSLQYEIDHYPDYDATMREVVLDRLLPGRGVAWVRYEQRGQPATGDDATHDPGSEDGQVSDDSEQESVESLQYECSPTDYVFWRDFRHSPARTWEEVTWVARRVYMTRKEGVERFGEDFQRVPLTHEPVGLEAMKDEGMDTEGLKKAVVWEIWDKSSEHALWLAEGFPTILDKKPDPLKLDRFFPCPKPLYATTTSDTLIPIPDYVEYQSQAKELDDLTQRIGKLTEACKVIGVYDASQTAIARMLSEGVDNQMIPVSNWAAFAEKSGLKGSVEFMDLTMVITALNELYLARENCKQVIYEVTGLSDIIRGASNAAETATAQQIKSQYASLRLKEMQKDVATFASDLLRKKAQLMCNFYRPESLIAMSGIEGTEDAPFAQQAIELLKSGSLRDFRIEVASDSLVELDEAGEKEARMEFIGAASNMLKEAAMAPQPMQKLAAEILMFGVRSFKAGRPLEMAFEEAISAIESQPPGPSPEEKAAQAQQQTEQMKLQAQQQAEQAKLQTQQAMEQMKLQSQQQTEGIKLQAQGQSEQIKAQAEMQKAQMQAAMDARLAEVEAGFKLQQEQLKQQSENARQSQQLAFEKWKVEFEAGSRAQTEIAKAQISAKSAADTTRATDKPEPKKPSRARLLRGADGRAEGVEKDGVKGRVVRDADGRVAEVIYE